MLSDRWHIRMKMSLEHLLFSQPCYRLPKVELHSSLYLLLRATFSISSVFSFKILFFTIIPYFFIKARVFMEFFRKFKLIFIKEFFTLILEKSSSIFGHLSFYGFNLLIQHRRHPKEPRSV